MNCGQCQACQRGHTNCCENLRVLGVMMDGGLTERMVLPARKLHPANGLAPEQCALVETLAIGCHAVNRGNPAEGESVLVVGAGPIGLAVLEFVKLSGARPIVMDMNEGRLEFCRSTMGVDHLVQAIGDGTETERLRDACRGHLPELVIDATGSNHSMSNALGYCAHAGRLVYVGITQKEISFLHAPIMHRRELTLMASRNALPNDFTRIIQLIESQKIDTQPWITHRTTFESFIEDFPAFTAPENGVIKAIVAMN